LITPEPSHDYSLKCIFYLCSYPATLIFQLHPGPVVKLHPTIIVLPGQGGPVAVCSKRVNLRLIIDCFVTDSGLLVLKQGLNRDQTRTKPGLKAFKSVFGPCLYSLYSLFVSKQYRIRVGSRSNQPGISYGPIQDKAIF